MDKELTADIIGVVNGDLISFIVNWPVASITAWVGQLTERDGVETLETFWHLVSNVEDKDEPNKLWSSVNVGADEFFRR
ncbi:hypothetical protein GOL39_32185 [Sinorhizobium medicae]|nr:hypothetical protein [Sinorhizobium medicae]